MTVSLSEPAIAILLARGGSKGIAGKNLRPVGGLSLVARSVLAARAARGVTGVYVSTDDPAIAMEARRFGAEVIDRPAEISTGAASSESGWLHALEVIGAAGRVPDRLVFLQCTSPFTTGVDIDACLAAMAAEGADCALSVMPDHGFLWGRDAAGRSVGINHDATVPRMRRQDLPPQFRESGAIYCVRTEAFRQVGRRFCGVVALCTVNHPPVEIDDPADLVLCDLIARQAGAADQAPPPAQLAALRAVVTDFDGVHTDDRVDVDETGLESVRVSRGDGLGLAQLQTAGRHHLLILSKEQNPVVQRRGEKLRIPVLQGIDDKTAALDAWLHAQGLSWDQVLYVGNDVNDLGPLSMAGVAACPSDAHPEVLALAHWILPAAGGHGALRHMADALLAADSAPVEPG